MVKRSKTDKRGRKGIQRKEKRRNKKWRKKGRKEEKTTTMNMN